MNTKPERNIDIDGPIIILSLKRSGSTLLRNIVGAHPDIFATALATGPLCAAIYTTNYLALASLGNGLTEAQRHEQAYARTGEVVRDMMQEHIDQDNARIWCDKSLINLNHLQAIRQALPEARYICLYRNCQDVVQSYLSMCRLGFLPEVCGHIQKNPSNVVAAIADYWVERNSTILEFEQANAGQCHRINYETLVSRPEETLSGLFGFLGMDWNNSLLEKTFVHARDGFAEGDIKFHFSKKIHTDSVGSGESLLMNNLPPQLQERMDTLLAKLGYNQSVLTEAQINSAVDAVLQQFKQVIDRKGDSSRSIGGTCKLVITGCEQPEWTIDLTKPEGVLVPGGGATDCVITLTADTLIGLATGKRFVVDAFQSGSISIAGNEGLATSFGKLLLS